MYHQDLHQRNYNLQNYENYKARPETLRRAIYRRRYFWKNFFPQNIYNFCAQNIYWKAWCNIQNDLWESFSTRPFQLSSW